MDQFEPVWRKLDEHGKAINALQANEMVTNHRLHASEKASADMCKQLIETRQEVVTLVNEKFTAISTALQSVQTTQAEDRGAKKNSNRGFYFLFSLISAIPALILIINTMSKS